MVRTSTYLFGGYYSTYNTVYLLKSHKQIKYDLRMKNGVYIFCEGVEGLIQKDFVCLMLTEQYIFFMCAKCILFTFKSKNENTQINNTSE